MWWQQPVKTLPLIILRNRSSCSYPRHNSTGSRNSGFCIGGSIPVLLDSAPNQSVRLKSVVNNEQVSWSLWSQQQQVVQCVTQLNRPICARLFSKEEQIYRHGLRKLSTFTAAATAAATSRPSHLISGQIFRPKFRICHVQDKNQQRHSMSTNMKNGLKSPVSLPNTIPPLHALTLESTGALREEFFKDVKNQVALHACTKMDPLEVCLTRSGLEDVSHIFSHKVEIEAKPITNQKQSGRCWIFAFLNTVRVPFMKQYNIDEFEFSQNYLFFWDKLERSNHFLNVVVEACKNGEDCEGRLLSFLLHDPISDGGQWDMIVNLVKKYGVMPKKCFPESFSSESSARMNAMLRSKLREFTKVIYEFIKNKPSDAATSELIRSQMSDIYKIVAICLGIPKNEFVWEYYDKSKAYHKIGPISSLKFYEEHVKPVFDVEDKVCLINDPRPKNEYGRLYSVQYLGNMTHGRQTIYNNQPVEILKKMVVESIKSGEVVWFGCEVQKRFAVKQGLEDLKIHDYNSVFGLDVSLPMTKAERLLYGESAMSHAMCITACGLDGDTALKFRVENSWGDDRCEKGYILMTSDWFDEFVFEVVVDKSHVPQEVLDVFTQTPIVLPAWDPMGTLAL